MLATGTQLVIEHVTLCAIVGKNGSKTVVLFVSKADTLLV